MKVGKGKVSTHLSQCLFNDITTILHSVDPKTAKSWARKEGAEFLRNYGPLRKYEPLITPENVTETEERSQGSEEEEEEEVERE